MNRIMVALVGVFVSLATFATATVTSVTARQRYPWNGLVDITVTFQGAQEDLVNCECCFVATNSSTKQSLPIAHLVLNGVQTGSDSEWTRKYIWNASLDIGAMKIDDVELSADAMFGIQLWENGPYWAECNVGASIPEESGYYFWWGDTVGCKRNAANDGWVSVRDGLTVGFCEDNCPTCGKSNSELQSAGYIDSTGSLVAACDAAIAYCGACWRMPTDADFVSLISNCTTTWTTRNGVYGRLFTGKNAYASKSIFFPAAGVGIDSDLNSFGSRGNYWSSTPYSQSSSWAYGMSFSSDYLERRDFDSRNYGRSVRLVRYKNKVIFDANGGSDSPIYKSYEDNEPLGRLPTAMRAGYSFAGWYTLASGGVQVTSSTTVTSSVTYYAHWVHVEGVQLWENGPLWAEFNVGAAMPEEAGYYFWWGDTVGYKRNAANDGWVSVRDGTSFSFWEDNCPTYSMGVSELRSARYTDVNNFLVASHDAANAYWSAGWRMPTSAEIGALISNCTTTWTTRNGVYGQLVTGKGDYASKSIFLPAAGFGSGSGLYYLGSYGSYWSSAPNLDDSAWRLVVNSDGFYRDIRIRYYGQSVRPVRGFAK